MEDFKWHVTLETGNDNIDAEHKIFVRLIKKLIHAINNKQEEYYLSRLVLEIQKYTEFHFVSEENLMIDLNYPAFDTHHLQHLKLLEKLNISLNYVELGKETYQVFVSFLIDWFKQHTINEDRKIAVFIQEKSMDHT
ncbi:MAG: hemerythrin family protein [Desulfobulbaceae bacterium]|nr:hemerythrin family protein [Desulfobulbaceae bacterium]